MSESAARGSVVRRHIEAGELFEASEVIADWLKRSPGDIDAMTAHAQWLRLCGRYADAQAWLDRVLEDAPQHGLAWVEAARLAMQTGAPDRALDLFDRANRVTQDETDWLAEWAALAHSMRQADIGEAVSAQWCERAPHSASAWFSLGLIRQQADKYDASLEAYERAMSLDADFPMLRNNLSALHYSRGDFEAALSHGRQAVSKAPNHHLAWTNLANVWLKLREPEKALIAARRAATLAPDYGFAQLALSNAARESQLWGEAFDAIVRAARVSGADPKIQFSVAMLQLMQGDFRNGWTNFEARWSGSPELENMVSFSPELRWRGEALTGKTLLVWGEQGHGDAIQFIRFVPELARQVRKAGGKVVCCCFPPLYELFKRSLARDDVEVLPSNVSELPRFDYQIPLASLPLVLGVTLESLSGHASYLTPDPSAAARWRDELGGNGRLKVGLVWTGSRNHQRNPLRAVSPERYAESFSAIQGVDWYSLQVGAAQDVERLAAAGLRVIDRTNELCSFDDTAALVCNLDIVVTVCTSVAHLAAALGRPTWLLLDLNPHWVWMTERRDSPWYPSVTLYRQSRYRDWAKPLSALRDDLEKAAAAGRVAVSGG